MPFFDRFWRLRLLGALLALAGAVAIPARSLAALVSLGKPGRPGPLDFLWAAGVLVGLSALAVWLAIRAPRARDRRERRLAALAGNQDAIPRLNAAGHGADVATSPQVPLSISWRAPWYHRFITSPLYIVAILPSFGIVGAFLLIYLVALLPTGKRALAEVFAWYPAPLAVFLLWAEYFFGSLLTVAGTALAGRTAGVEATADGLTARPYWGRPIFVRWEEARLLELSGSWLNPTFRLYGAHSVARWRNQALGLPARYGSAFAVFQPVGMRREDTTRQFNAILRVVVARSGLAPRGFSPDALSFYSPASPMRAKPVKKPRNIALPRRRRPRPGASRQRPASR